MKSFIYVISGEHGRQKIGISDDPNQRIRNLQTGSPYPLRFEFVGEAENSAAGPIEVEAHFMLAQHRVEGEWFVVPPDVAVTAVMAAAHRLGYRIKPVDADKIAPKYPNLVSGRAPAWVLIAMTPFVLFFAHAFFFRLLPEFNAGHISEMDTAIGGFVYLVILIILRPIITLLGVWTGWGPKLDPSNIWSALKAPWTEEQRY